MMLDSKRELVVLDASLCSSSTKRSPFHLLSSIFSKKKSSLLENEKCFDNCSEPQQDVSLNPPESFLDSNHSYDIRSPVKRKNLQVELENLHLSRQDNPYLKQLNLPDETLRTFAEQALLQSQWLMDKEVDIHQHLVRSPPPQFPQNITHFMYNSPKRQISQTASGSLEELQSPIKQCKKAKSLNPIQPKKDLGVLDPGIREVLEYQRTQLLAGIQHSLSIGQAKFGTLPSSYVPDKSTLHHNVTLPEAQARWTNDSGSRMSMTASQSSTPNASSLPGLTNCYLDLVTLGDNPARKTTLGPVRIGRTLSDSICHDNKCRIAGVKQ